MWYYIMFKNKDQMLTILTQIDERWSTFIGLGARPRLFGWMRWQLTELWMVMDVNSRLVNYKSWVPVTVCCVIDNNTETLNIREFVSLSQSRKMNTTYAQSHSACMQQHCHTHHTRNPDKTPCTPYPNYILRFRCFLFFFTNDVTGPHVIASPNSRIG